MRAALRYFSLLAFACVGSAVEAQELLEGWPFILEGSALRSLTVVDVDRDGTPEIAFGATGRGTYLLDADGTVRDGWPFANWNAPSAVWLRAGDVDGDGEIEFVFSAYGGGKYLHVVDASGVEQEGWPKEPPVGTSFSDLVLADLDGDSDLEILSKPNPPHAEIYAWHGDGTAVDGWPVDIEPDVVHDELYVGAIAAGDLDFDGRSEVIPGTYVYSDGDIEVAVPLTVLNGDGTLREGFPVSLPGWYGHDAIIYPTIADLDRDHECEIVGTSLDTDYFQRADGRAFRNPWYNYLGVPRPMVCADLVGDGQLEIIVPRFELRVYDVEGDIIARRFTLEAGYTRWEGVSVGDVDGDGLQEIAAWSREYREDGVPDQRYSVHVMDRNLEDLPGWPIEMEDDGYGPGIYETPCLVDMDGDGDAEVIYDHKDAVYVRDVERIGETPAPPEWPVSGHDATWSHWYDIDKVPRQVFLRGDANQDESIDIADVGFGLDLMFADAETQCPAASDYDADGEVALADMVGLLDYLFLDGTPPATPFPLCGQKPPDERTPCVQFECPPEIAPRLGPTLDAAHPR